MTAPFVDLVEAAGMGQSVNLSNYILSNDLINVYGHMMVSISLGHAGADPINVRRASPANENKQNTTGNKIAAPSASTTHATHLLVRPEINELILSIVVDMIRHAVVHGEDEVEQRVSGRLQERGR